MLTALPREDDLRINFSERKVHNKTRIMRQKQRRERKTKSKNKPNSYLSGSFGLSVEPDQLSKDPIMITFIDEKEAISYDKWMVCFRERVIKKLVDWILVWYVCCHEFLYLLMHDLDFYLDFIYFLNLANWRLTSGGMAGVIFTHIVPFCFLFPKWAGWPPNY